MGPKAGTDGTYILLFPFPDTDKLPGIARDDIGFCAASLFDDPASIGTTVGIVGETLTGPEMAAKVSKALDIKCDFQSVPVDDYKKFGFPGCQDLGNMFLWQSINNKMFCAARDAALTKKLYPACMDLDGFLAKFGGAIPK